MKEISYNEYECKYRFDRQIDQGGFARVCRIQNNKTDIYYALKKPKKNKEKDYISDVRNEIRILSRYQHPRIVKIFQYYQVQNELWTGKKSNEIGIILELAECSLEHMIKHKRPLGDQRSLVRQMISLIRLLDYLQSEGIAHRDIKPGNILIFPNKTHDHYFWKLADFGLALNIRENTKNDCFVGSLQYASPKLKIKYRTRDPHIKTNPFKDDVYSLGLTLVEILTRNRNYSPYIYESLRKMCSEKILVEMIDMMLEEDEENRPCFRQLMMILNRDYKNQLEDSIEDERKTIKFYNSEEVFSSKQSSQELQHEHYSSYNTSLKITTKKKPSLVRKTLRQADKQIYNKAAISCIFAFDGKVMCGLQNGKILFISGDDQVHMDRVHGRFVSVLSEDRLGNIWSSGEDGRVIRWNYKQLSRALVHDVKIEEKKPYNFHKPSDANVQRKYILEPTQQMRTTINVPHTRKGGVSAMHSIDEENYGLGFYDGHVFLTWDCMEFYAPIHTSPVTNVKLCIKHKKAFTASGDGLIKAIDLTTGALQQKLHRCNDFIAGMEVIQSHNKLLIIAVTCNGTYYQLDENLICIRQTTLSSSSNSILACLFRERNCLLLSQSMLTDAKEDIKLNLETKGWNCLCATPEGGILLGSFQGQVTEVAW